MSNLYNIQEKYLQLMQQIEELEGEITPEMEQELAITEQECEEKIKSYHHIIKNSENDIQIIRDEKERLSKLANTKENLIKRLKLTVLEACTLFGYDGKSGNKKIDYDTLKVYTVNKDKIEIDEVKFNELALNKLWLDTDNQIEALEYSLNINLTHKQVINNSGVDKNSFIVNINKTKIKKVIESGIEVPYCKIVNNPYITFK
jgi:hypothetical protein